jgi:DNA polymerase III epsilon subunit-like protein
MSRLFFFDVETTGLPTRRGAHYTETAVWPRIVSISWAVHGDDGQAIDRRGAIIKPAGWLIPSSAAAIHGITTDLAKRVGRPLSEVLFELLAVVRTLAPTSIVAHNAEFDRAVLLSELARNGLDTSLERLPVTCTMQSAVNFCRLPGGPGGAYKWPKLEELHQRLFGQGFDNAHDATADVEACIRCYFELRRRGVLGTGRTSTAPPASAPSARKAPGREASKWKKKLERILAWADDHPDFDTTFVESVLEKLEDYGTLTEAQQNAIDRIIDRWDVD